MSKRKNHQNGFMQGIRVMALYIGFSLLTVILFVGTLIIMPVVVAFVAVMFLRD